MSITATSLQIPEVLLLEPDLYTDDRGYLFEAWNDREFSTVVGKPTPFVQDNQSSSHAGVLRGLHFQHPDPQGKLVRVVTGATFTVAVDIRKTSVTFGQWVSIELTAENRRQLWIPPGFAHGALALVDNTELFYKLTAFYRPGCDRAIRWDDPAIGIDWPLVTDPVLSNKDRNAPLLADAEVYD